MKRKAVLFSIRREWCERIISGEKTVEARKTIPALDTPFKCYIYQTQGGGVIAEWNCDKLIWVVSHPEIFAGRPMFHQKAIDEACMTIDEAERYSGGKNVYGLCIANLKRYDAPKDLRAFHCYGHLFPMAHPPQSWCYVEELDDHAGILKR